MFVSIKKLISNSKQVRQYLSNRKFKKDLWGPLKVQKSDVFLVSYPRSGSNMLRKIITDYYTRVYKNDTIDDFDSARILMPNLAIENLEQINELTPPRLIKTHWKYPVENMPRVVYVYRDGRDVYRSFYAYRKHHYGLTLSFSKFLSLIILEENNSWSNHCKAWIDFKNKKNIIFLKYEDLINTHAREKELERLFTFLNWEINQMVIKKVLKGVDIDVMKVNPKNDSVVIKDNSEKEKHELFDDRAWSIFNKYEQKTLQFLGYHDS